MLTLLARRPDPAGDDLAATIRHRELRRLATAIIGATDQLTANAHQLTEIVQAHAPQLIARRGIGRVCAAQAIVSWSHPGQCRNEAVFAALAGASPVPASSGRVIRHRLNRGGDRALTGRCTTSP